jgi:hypothetical protein
MNQLRIQSRISDREQKNLASSSEIKDVLTNKKLGLKGVDVQSSKVPNYSNGKLAIIL